MKAICLPLFFLLIVSSATFAQPLDTAAVEQEVDSLVQISRAHTNNSQFEQAFAAHQAAEKLVVDYLGKETAAYGSIVFNYGRILDFKRDIPEAEKLYKKSLEIRESVIGKTHPDYATSLNNLAILYWETRQYEKAEPLFLEAIAIRKETLGTEHPDYASSLNNLAALYEKMGELEKVELLYLEAIAIRKKKLGEDHPEYADVLDNLAILYRKLGQLQRAEPLHMEAKTIRKNHFGKKHIKYAISLDNLATLNKELGNFEAAEAYSLAALDIIGQLVGTDHPVYAQGLNNLASLYRQMGIYSEAERIHLQAKAIREKARDQEPYAQTLLNLANLYWEMEQYDKADPLYQEARSIRAKTLGEDHPDHAKILGNQATFYAATGQHEKAEPLFRQTISIIEQKQGKEHQDYAQILNNLATLYSDMKAFDQAEPLFQEALDVWEKTLGRQSAQYAVGLEGLASLYRKTGAFEKAQPLFTQAALLNQQQISRGTKHLSETEIYQYMTRFVRFQGKLFSFATSAGKSTPATQTCFDNILFYKGFLLNVSAHLKQLALSNAVTEEQYHQFQACHRRLAAEYAKPVSARKNVEKLEHQAQTLEKALARQVAGFGEALHQVSWKEVQTQLQAGECAIEFVDFQYFDPAATDSTLYAALILAPEWEAPLFIPLFDEKELDALLQTSGERRADYVDRLYSLADRGLSPVGERPKTLNELIWQPLKNTLTGMQTIYFSPSGLLHQVNLSAIPINEDETLADRFHLIQLNSTRQLALRDKVDYSEATATLFGGIRYEADTAAIAEANTRLNADGAYTSRGERNFTQADSTWQTESWKFLSGTEKEMNKLYRILENAGYQPILFQGYDATEEAFKSIGTPGHPSPQILHIASHGFFFPNPARRSLGEGGPFNDQLVFKSSEHPMIRSGLILAGGNHAWQTGKPPKPNMEDGILTAYEISQMNLSNTELVVLSACETGLGDIKGNEGVYGLQRAFRIAGAKYLIMSLWKVSDEQTAYFMEAFYQYLLEGHLSIPDAFSLTQRKLRENPFVSTYDWAGFVLVE